MDIQGDQGISPTLLRVTPEIVQEGMQRRKLENGCGPFIYPDIPEGALDIPPNRPEDYEENGIGLDFHERATVKKTDSVAWGTPEEASARACVETVTPENEALIRTYHPSLATAPRVQIHREMSGNIIWLVWIARNVRIEHTHAGQREIHVMENFFFSFPLHGVYLTSPPVMIRRMIYPRRMLSAGDISAIQTAFPSSIGVRILISGLVIVFYKNKEDLKKALIGSSSDAGGLDVGLDILSMKPSTTTVLSGLSVEASPDSLDCKGNLGLRIKMPNGDEAITTATHGFVKLPKHSRIFVRLFANWSNRAKEFLSKLIAAKVKTREQREKSPLGKNVHLAGMATEIGSISRTFDQPSSVLPYPAGYRHDLSLVTGPNLPQIVSPAGKISGWGDYQDALDGKPVFAARPNPWLNNARGETGAISTEATKAAIVEGTDYIWASRTVSASLVWRTVEDYTSIQRDSGSVLCLGTPSDASVKALVFQNYETPVRRSMESMEERCPAGDHSWTLKGGFLLPQEVRNCSIQCDGQEDLQSYT